MDWWGRLWGAKKWFLAGLAPFLSDDRMWIAAGAVVVVVVALILAVCWLACRLKDDDIETPILTVRRGMSKRQGSKNEAEEKGEKDDAKAS